jgi:hypothetical protein
VERGVLFDGSDPRGELAVVALPGLAPAGLLSGGHQGYCRFGASFFMSAVFCCKKGYKFFEVSTSQRRIAVIS